jgi:hypothetical protein
VLTFTGSFNGSLSATGGQLTGTFSGPTTRSVQLGSYDYSVNLGNFVPPPDPSGKFPGLFLASITAQAPTPQKLPEPGTLALAGAGALLVTLTSRRRPRRRRASDV